MTQCIIIHLPAGVLYSIMRQWKPFVVNAYNIVDAMERGTWFVGRLTYFKLLRIWHQFSSHNIYKSIAYKAVFLEGNGSICHSLSCPCAGKHLGFDVCLMRD